MRTHSPPSRLAGRSSGADRRRADDHPRRWPRTATSPTLPGGKVRTLPQSPPTRCRRNCAPERRNMLTGRPFGDVESFFVRPQQPPHRFHLPDSRSTATYTDATFTHARRPRRTAWKHLWFMGPSRSRPHGGRHDRRALHRTTRRSRRPCIRTTCATARTPRARPTIDGTSGCRHRPTTTSSPVATHDLRLGVSPSDAGPGAGDAKLCHVRCTTAIATRSPTPTPA